MANAQPRTQQERRSESDRRMIEAAIELFAAHGYTKTSLNQIGQVAGCTGTLISSRFGSKEGLLRAVLAKIMSRFATDRMQIDQIENVFVGTVERGKGPSSRTKRGMRKGGETANNKGPTKRQVDDDAFVFAGTSMNEFLQIFLDDVEQKQSRVRALHVIMGESLGALPEINKDIIKVNKMFRGAVRRLVIQGIEAGEYRNDLDPKEASIIIVAILRGIINQVLMEPKIINMKTLTPTVQRTIKAYLASPGNQS